MPSFFYETEFILIVSVLSIALILYINRFNLKRSIHDFRTNRCLGSLGLEQISNVKCPDGLDNFFVFDRLVLLDHAILIINYKKYPGRIFASEKIDQWTQILGQKSYKFPNPLFKLNLQVQALQKCLPDVPVEACIFFDSSAEFANDIPNHILHPNHMDKRFFHQNRHAVKPEIMHAWKTILDMKSKQT